MNKDIVHIWVELVWQLRWSSFPDCDAQHTNKHAFIQSIPVVHRSLAVSVLFCLIHPVLVSTSHTHTHTSHLFSSPQLIWFHKHGLIADDTGPLRARAPAFVWVGFGRAYRWKTLTVPPPLCLREHCRFQSTFRSPSSAVCLLDVISSVHGLDPVMSIYILSCCQKVWHLDGWHVLDRVWVLALPSPPLWVHTRRYNTHGSCVCQSLEGEAG